VAALRAAGIELERPRGALYLWFEVPTRESSREFALRLIEEQAVLVLPGSGLGPGGEGFVRVALTLAENRYEEAAARIARAL
jgi:LL-diaminopimelate aminotransferase